MFVPLHLQFGFLRCFAKVFWNYSTDKVILLCWTLTTYSLLISIVFLIFEYTKHKWQIYALISSYLQRGLQDKFEIMNLQWCSEICNQKLQITLPQHLHLVRSGQSRPSIPQKPSDSSSPQVSTEKATSNSNKSVKKPVSSSASWSIGKFAKGDWYGEGRALLSSFFSN